MNRHLYHVVGNLDHQDGADKGERESGPCNPIENNGASVPSLLKGNAQPLEKANRNHDIEDNLGQE